MAETCSICGDRPRRRPGRSWCEGCYQAYHRGYRAADRKWRRRLAEAVEQADAEPEPDDTAPEDDTDAEG
jgi:hypothetical protein